MVSTVFQSQQELEAVGTRAKPLIMIVDDNVELLEELENLLKLGGYDVIALSDGTKVLETALKNKPDLILLDVKMSPKAVFKLPMRPGIHHCLKIPRSLP